MLIGLFGLAVTLAASVWLRAGELATLGALGFSRRMLSRAVMLEGALIAAVGLLIGLACGVAIGAILTQVINPQAFHWRMPLDIPWPGARRRRWRPWPRPSSPATTQRARRPGCRWRRSWPAPSKRPTECDAPPLPGHSLAAADAAARAPQPPRPAHRRLSAGDAAACDWLVSRATTARTRIFVPNGGTSPARWTSPAGRHRFSADLLPQPAGHRRSAALAACRAPDPLRTRRADHARRAPAACRTRRARQSRRQLLQPRLRRGSIGAWRMHRQQRIRAGEVLRLQMQSPQFSYDFTLTPSQPLLLQGDQGYSRKGHGPELASYYVSWPQLQVGGTGARRPPAGGERPAWFDHEWSTATAWRPRRRLGLAGHQPRRRRRADGFPHARCRRRNALRARRLARRRRPPAPVRCRRGQFHAAAPTGRRHAAAPVIRCSSKSASASRRCARCRSSTTRNCRPVGRRRWFIGRGWSGSRAASAAVATWK
jgi:hypothetical protein